MKTQPTPPKRSSVSKANSVMRGIRTHALWLTVLGTWLLISLLVYGSLNLDWLTVEQYTCTFEENQCPPVVTAELNRLLGSNLLFINYSKIEAQIAANLSQVATVKLTPDPPHIIKVALLPHTPFATLQTANTTYLLSSTGHLFHNATTSNNLPIILADGLSSISLNQDQITEPSVLQSLELLNLLTTVGLPNQKLKIENPTTAILTLNAEKAAVFSLIHNLNRQVSSLQLILQKSTMPEAKPIIDLRFEKPVLRPSLKLESTEATVSTMPQASGSARDIVRP